MALLGKSFNDYVDKQVKIRQKSLGGPSLTSKTLKVYNSQSPWIRLASSVNITAGDTTLPGKSVLEQVKDLFDGFEYVGDKLAKSFVLFGGVNTEKGGVENMPTGINKTPLKSAYGFGYKNLNRDNSRGYVPMPGVESVDFSYKNDGALAQASIQIKCFSPEQFQMIDILFQRPGYTVLLEFGHSVFKDNEGKVQYAGQGDYSYETEPFSNLYNPKEDKGFYNLLDLIQVEKEKWNGNYEAFYAKITKFNWKFNSDGSYNITVNLIGLGDVVSSLKLNTSPPKQISKKSNTTVINNVEIDLDLIKRNIEDSKIGMSPGQREIMDKYDPKNVDFSKDPTGKLKSTSSFNYELYRIQKALIGFIGRTNAKDDMVFTYKSTPYSHFKGGTLENKELKIKYGVLGIRNNNTDGFDPSTYISFSTLLSIIQQYSNQYSQGIPLIQLHEE